MGKNIQHIRIVVDLPIERNLYFGAKCLSETLNWWETDGWVRCGNNFKSELYKYKK